MKRAKKAKVRVRERGERAATGILGKLDLERSPRSEWGNGFVHGVETAADLADQYNGVTLHDHRLGDCILGKLNIRKAHPRKNKPSPWILGSKWVGEYVRVAGGNMTGTEGTIDFVDHVGKRYLVDAGDGRSGGLHWILIEHCYIPALQQNKED